MKTRINREELIDLFVALGWSRAMDWDDRKLAERGPKIPGRLERKQVPEEFHPLYDRLSQVTGRVQLVSGMDVEHMSMTSLRALVEERNMPMKLSRITDVEQLRKAVKRQLNKQGDPDEWKSL